MKSVLRRTDVLIALSMLIGLTEIHAADSFTIKQAGFATPESVEYYPEKDVYLVGNINGSPLEKDDNGFISQVSPEGELLNLRWIDGVEPGVRLNAPKGLAINEGILYVADLDEVHMFELPNGRQLKSVQISGSTFLNGITPNPTGGVFVTDSGLKAGAEGFVASGTDAVYEVTTNGKYRAVFKGSDMGRPNGIIYEEGSKMIVSLSGSVSVYDKSGNKRDYPSPPEGGLDGLLKMHDGSYLISSWGGSSIYRLNANGKYHVLAANLESPADMGFDSKRNRILVPLFYKNEIRVLPYKQ